MSRNLAPGMATIRSAVENASPLPITDEGIIAILQGGPDPASHLHAIFGDVSLRALDGAGASAGVPLATILQAYDAARTAAAVANPELDRLLDEPW